MTFVPNIIDNPNKQPTWDYTVVWEKDKIKFFQYYFRGFYYEVVDSNGYWHFRVNQKLFDCLFNNRIDIKDIIFPEEKRIQILSEMAFGK